MRKLLTTSAMGLALIGTVAGAATSADAQRFHGGGYHGGGYRGGYHGGYGGYRGGYGYRGYRGGGGAAVAAGILGLGIGAAIASDRGYYGRGYYPGYYGAPAGYYGYGGCRTSWRWDGYYGDYVPVRACW